jgi:hypothetical protein
MLWVLFIGGSAAHKKTSKVWSVKTTSRILRVKETNINTAATAFIWPESRKNYDDSTGKDFEMDDIVLPEIATGIASIVSFLSILTV